MSATKPTSDERAAPAVPFTFLDGPTGAAEWPGTPIGQSNVVSRIKGRTNLHDKGMDRDPQVRDALLAWAEEFAAHHSATLQRHDAIVHGIRVRLLTNSAHQHDFFVRNWYDPDEWRASSGATPPAEPQLIAYAFIGVPGKPEAAYYSRERGVVLFVNSSYYGQLKSWVLGAVGRFLAEEQGIHSIHGACVELDGSGILYVAPTGTGKSTSSYGLMTFPNTRFHSDDWVYVRYTVGTRQGGRVAPMVLPGRAGPARGYDAIAALLDRDIAQGPYEGFDLGGRHVSGMTSDLLLDEPIQAFAYTSEKRFYLRSNLIESFAPAAVALLDSVFENVPDVTPAYLEAERETLAAIEADLGTTAQSFASGSTLRTLMARMIAFDNARSMLDTTRVFGADRVFANPLEPTRLAVVFLLERDFTADHVISPLGRHHFLGALLDGSTPTGSQETAYNAYRAVDDAAERRFISELEAAGQSGAMLARAFERQQEQAPATLRAEMTLFSALHGATHCFTLNTILQSDPSVTSRKEAVRRTLLLILAAARGGVTEPASLHDYRRLL